MKTKEILSNINKAINKLYEKDSELLTRGLNELTISTTLLCYLKPLFKNYDVDAEYNGDSSKSSDKKALSIAKTEIVKIKKNTNDDDIYNFNPDIIIHKRGENKNNLVVIEIKKDTHNTKGKLYDLIKLKHLTIDYSGNNYNYKLGIAITFGTKSKAKTQKIKYFQGGVEKNVSELN